ncbi:unnamed protein product [Aureobasidium vineae]|uniref:Uncharacterized protein n=1 Tax=Aureobasidium vineae TaxID=2773715 RepID=A0A9N8JM29_9PEZI|nr:unnamed protein product [Aureobasidium vineae]
MLNEEISNATPRTNGSFALDHIDQSLLNEPNPVFGTIQNGETDMDAIQKAMSDLKTRLHNHEDKVNVLAHLCEGWKGELERYYPLMKGKPQPRNGLDSLTPPRPGTSTTKRPAAKEKIPSKSQKQLSTPKIRYTHGRTDFVEPGLATSPWSPSKLRYTEGNFTFSRDSKQDEPPSTQQDKPTDKEDSKRPHDHPSKFGERGDDKDDGFSIFAIQAVRYIFKKKIL